MSAEEAIIRRVKAPWGFPTKRLRNYWKEVIDIINLKLLNDKGEVKFKAYGAEIDTRYNCEYEEGDKWRVELCDSDYCKIALDETMAESIIYVPDRIFEFKVPFGSERIACYGEAAFSGDSHRV